MKKLFTTQYGSQLYGTNTASSDLDIVHVVLPSIEDLMLLHPVRNVFVKGNKQALALLSERNTPDKVGVEVIPIQVFARHFLEGQPYAHELAYALECNHCGQEVHDPEFRSFCRELRNQFLTSEIGPSVGPATEIAFHHAEGEDIQWNEAMHARRVLDQTIELFSTGKMVFPFAPPHIDFLLAMKEGQLEKSDVVPVLQERIFTLRELQTRTSLPPVSEELRIEHEAWLLGWMYRFYEGVKWRPFSRFSTAA